jgi:secondary thiamine-phosphate synthase enzyme
MMIIGKEIVVPTKGFSDIHDLTQEIEAAVMDAGIKEGLVNVFAVGSTASITTIEFEPALTADMTEALENLWPKDQPTRHGTTWGDDNGFSHLRASFLGPNVTVPVHRGKLVLGTWQQVVVIDHDNHPRDRRIFLQVVGE